MADKRTSLWRGADSCRSRCVASGSSRPDHAIPVSFEKGRFVPRSRHLLLILDLRVASTVSRLHDDGISPCRSRSRNLRNVSLLPVICSIDSARQRSPRSSLNVQEGRSGQARKYRSGFNCLARGRLKICAQRQPAASHAAPSGQIDRATSTASEQEARCRSNRGSRGHIIPMMPLRLDPRHADEAGQRES